MASKFPTVDPVYKWLRHVDEQLSPGEGVEFLKLALHAFLRLEYAKAKELKKPSSIHKFLLEKCFKGDKQMTFQWFAYALGLLTGDLRGAYLVSEECLQQYRLSTPSTPHELDAERQFYKCLTIIGRKARGSNLEDTLKKRFAKRRFLNINPHHLKHLPDLFIRLAQEQIVSPTNTDPLLVALLKCGSNLAKQCLFHLNEYHKSVGLPEIESVKGVKKEQFPETSTFENNDTSSDPNTSASRCVGKSRNSSMIRKYQHGRDKHAYTKLGTEGYESLKTIDGEVSDETSNDSDDEVKSEDDGTPDHTPKHSRLSGTFCKRTFLCISWTVSICLALAMVGVLGVEVWKNLFIEEKFDSIVVYDGPAVVVQVDTFYDSQLRLIAQPEVPLGDRIVQIYRFNSSCEELPVTFNVVYWSKSNISGPENYTHHYLLPTSTLNYSISLVDSVSEDESNAAIDNVVKGYIYITRGPELKDFDSRSCTDSDCEIVYNKPFIYKRADSFIVDRSSSPGYYNLHSVYISNDYQYSLKLTVNAATVDLGQGQHVCNITDIDEGGGSCSINFQFQIGQVCLVAYTKLEGNSPYPYAIVNVEVTKQILFVVMCSVVPAVLLILLTFVCLSIICCCCVKRKDPPQYVSQS